MDSETRLEGDPPEGRGSVIARFVRRANWLELSRAYQPYLFVDSVLAPESAALLWDDVGATIRETAKVGISPVACAKEVLRIAYLARSGASGAGEALRVIAKESDLDPAIRAFAAYHTHTPLERAPFRVEGASYRVRNPWLRLARWVSGYAFFAHLVRS